jgi:hypothetical protein
MGVAWGTTLEELRASEYNEFFTLIAINTKENDSG